MTSQINPNNVDGTYPIAGQANNTQGFRDNFTNIKTNFQYAQDEITDLENKSVLKSALSGSTLDNNMSDNLIYAVKLNDVSYNYVALTATSGSIDIDYSAATFQQISTTGSISLSFSNWPASGTAGTVRVGFNITNVAYTVTLPAAVSQGLTHLQGVSPGTPGVSNTITFGAVGNYAFEFVTIDGGTTVWIFDDSRPTDYFNSVVEIANTTVSTSSTTGALVVTGGLGVGGNINLGGNISLTGNVLGNLNVTGNVAGGNVKTVGLISATGNVTGGNILFGSGVVSGTGNVVSTGNIVSAGSGTVGYTAGAGGTVSQAGNKSGGVTLNKPSGEITMQNTALGADTSVSFTLTNSTISAKDVLVMNIVGGAVTAATYNLDAVCSAGSAVVTVRNITAGSLSEALVLRYVLVRGSTT